MSYALVSYLLQFPNLCYHLYVTAWIEVIWMFCQEQISVAVSH